MTPDVQIDQILSRESRERFERDGLFVIDDPCSPELIDAVTADVESLYHDAFHPGPQVVQDHVVFSRYPGRDDRYHWHRVREAWKLVDSVRALALAPRVLEITEQLFGRKVLPFQSLNFPIGTQQPAHADSFYFNSDPAGYMCGVWVACEDLDMENGPLVYYPGSHKLPMPTWEAIEDALGEHPRQSDYPSLDEYRTARGQLYMRYCEHLIETHGLEPEYGTIRKGQAILWAPNLLHGGAPQKDKSRTRHSQVTHYFFEDCRHYNPVHVEEGHVFWEYHEWIRDPVPTYSDEALKDLIEANAPIGATVLIATDGTEPLLELNDRRVVHFPETEGGTRSDFRGLGTEAVDLLEQSRAKGADQIAFPKQMLPFLEWRLPDLQDHLESNYRALLRDGAYCATYALD